MGKTFSTGYLQNIIQYDENDNIILPSLVGTGSRMVVAAADGTLSFQTIPTVSNLNATPTSRSITLNGTTVDLSADRSFTLYTDNISEDGSPVNLWFTNARARAAVSVSGSISYDSATGVFSYTTPNTDGIVEGALNLYYTNARFDTRFGTKTTSDLTEGTNLYYTQSRFDTAFGGKSTSNLTEGTNLYYTDARVAAYLLANTYATQSYVGTAISNLVDAAPGTLDTLNELAAALGDDPNFATTIATSIGTKQAQLNGTGFVKISGTTISYDNSTYLTSYTETDPIYTASTWYTTTNNATNWNTAYGWGNHASGGYLTTANAATTYASLTGSYANPSWITSLAYSKITGVPAFLTSYTETDTLANVTSRGASTSTAVTFSGGASISSLLINGATAWTEGSLALGAHSADEGGQLVLNKATSYTYAAHIDVWHDVLRFLYGTNTATSGVAMSLNLSTKQLILPQYTTSSTFTGTAAGVLAFDSSGNILTIAVPGGAVSSVNAGTGVSVNSNTGAVTVSIGQSVATSASPTFNQIITTSNGGGTNVKLGDDAWIGDTNVSNTVGIVGQQNSDRAYISFGSDNTVTLGRIGTGALTWGGNTVYHAGNLTNLNQLTNGPGYITGYTETDTLASVTGRGSTTSTALSLSGKVTFSSAVANRPQMPGGILGLDTGDGNFDIWGISRDYYPSHATAANAWGLRWNGDNNDFEFVGGGTSRVILDMDGGNITATGTLSASGYNKTNWDTAYGWGNHASAGYALANHTHIISPVAESSVSPSGISIQAGPGSSNTQSWLYPYGTKLSVITGAGRSFEIMTTTYPEGQLVLRTLGSGNTWDAWKTVLDSNNYSTYAPTLTGGGASGTWGISITGNSSTTSQRSFNYIYGTEYLESAGAVYGTIFYDNNDRAYYLNPNGGSRLRNLYVGDSGDDWSDPGGWGTQVRFSNGPHVKFVLHARTPGIEAGMYVHTPSSVYIGSYTAHSVNMMVGGNSRLLIEDGRVYSHVYMEAAGSMRAPIFYDSNDTNYYVDPNSSSRVYHVNADYLSVGQAINTGYRIITNGDYYANGGGNYWAEGRFKQYRGSGTWHDVIDSGNIGSQSVSYASNAGTVGNIGVSTLRGGVSSNSISFYVNGDANTYYPVVLSLGGQFGMNRYSVTRGYSDPAPWDPIGTGSHKGGLTLTFDCSSDIAWGGNDKSWRIIQFAESYTNMVAGMALPVTDGIIVWLRGGGAYYTYQGPSGVNHSATVYYSGYSAANGAVYYTRTSLSNVDSEIRAKWPIRGYGDGAMYVGNNEVLHLGNYISYQDKLYYQGSQRLWTGSDGTRNSGWAYHQDNSTGLHWPNNGWHFYPKDASDMYLRSGGSSVSLVMNITGTTRGYVYADGSNQIGFLNQNRDWIFRMTSGGDAYAVSYYSSESTSKYFTSNGSSYGTWYIGGNNGGYSGFRVDGGMQLMIHTNGASGPTGFWMNNWSILTYVDGSQYLYHNGYEKIRTQSDGAYITGTLYATGDVIAYYSDIRLKKDVTVIDGALDKIKQLRGVTYTWNDQEVNIVKERAGTKDIGLIAQEVEAVEPLLITEYQTQLNTPDNDPGKAADFVPVMSETYKTIKYEKLVALLVEGMKEQQTEIEELKDLVKQLINR